MISKDLKQQISEILGETILTHSIVTGGGINQAYRLKTAKNHYFFKTHEQPQDMFLKEANGLKELSKAKKVRVPRVLAAHRDFLLLEFIESSDRHRTQFQNKLGIALAELHTHSSIKFGFYEDNWIGATEQKNSWNDSWMIFYRDQRLKFQYELANVKGLLEQSLSDDLEQVIDHIGFWLDRNCQPALIHGDLWSGNVYQDDEGEIVLIDPAIYYADPLAELGMLTLFGHVTEEFYQAYGNERAASECLPLYQLYHALNHLNLFGPSYHPLCQSLCDQLLRRL